MTIQRMDHVGIVVADLEAATAFCVELGMELEAETPVEGRWVDRVGLDDVRVDIAMMRTPDGHHAAPHDRRARVQRGPNRTPARSAGAPRRRGAPQARRGFRTDRYDRCGRINPSL